MKQPGTTLEHQGQTYLVVEAGFNEQTRVVTVLSAPGNTGFPHDDGTQPVTWRDQGDWFPVARWDHGQMVLQHKRHEDRRPLLDEIVQHYIQDRKDTPDVAWTMEGVRGFAGSIEPALPMGVAVILHDDLEQAPPPTGDQTLVPIQNLAQFLTHLAREGYAGAMWNAELPIFFCIDEHGELQFLRVGQGDGEKVEMDILEPSGRWETYVGEQEIEFLDHRDACDARLVEALGRKPVMDWPARGRFWSIGPDTGTPGVIRIDDDGSEYGLLFGSEESAEAWREELDTGWVAFAVDDITAYLTGPELKERGALLNPGDHRVRSGVLWSDGERTVLDSFSGFWSVHPDGFTLLDDEGEEE